MITERTRVLYIAGWGRSGSTILAEILGQIHGFFPVGEVYRVWRSAFWKGSRCACGEHIQACQTWRPILSKAFGEFEAIDSERLLRASRWTSRSLYLPAALPAALFPPTRDLLRHAIGGYLETIQSIYAAIRETTQCDLIVDSSKYPMHAYALGLLPEIDLRVVHLVRDPRAVAFSWRRPRFDPGTQAPMKKKGLIWSSLLWSSWNLAVHLLLEPDRASRDYMRVRYESFAARPRPTVLEILKFAGFEGREPPFLDDTHVNLEPRHLLGGNPVRFTHGTIGIRPDREWESGLNLREKMFVSAMTFPLSRVYGYGGT